MKPILCPFCASTDIDVGPQQRGYLGVRCKNCEATIQHRKPKKYPEGVTNAGELQQWVMDQTVIAWNRRSGDVLLKIAKELLHGLAESIRKNPDGPLTYDSPKKPGDA